MTAKREQCIDPASWPAVRLDLDVDGYSLPAVNRRDPIFT